MLVAAKWCVHSGREQLIRRLTGFPPVGDSATYLHICICKCILSVFQFSWLVMHCICWCAVSQGFCYSEAPLYIYICVHLYFYLLANCICLCNCIWRSICIFMFQSSGCSHVLDGLAVSVCVTVSLLANTNWPSHRVPAIQRFLPVYLTGSLLSRPSLLLPTVGLWCLVLFFRGFAA